ncbi:MAG TPA: DUF6101 family protein [Pseudolabrys sp.]
MRSGGHTAGSGRTSRLDPFCLPVRFAAKDAAADERVRHVELHRERIVVRRSLRGIPMALNVPVSAFTGISVRTTPGEGQEPGTYAVVIEHKDPSLAMTLFVTAEVHEAFAEWRTWGNVLGLPLLVEDEGALHEPFDRMGSVRIARVRQRRRRHNAIKRRRPTMSFRRRTGKITDATPVHRDEREIIARN